MSFKKTTGSSLTDGCVFGQEVIFDLFWVFVGWELDNFNLLDFGHEWTFGHTDSSLIENGSFSDCHFALMDVSSDE